MYTVEPVGELKRFYFVSPKIPGVNYRILFDKEVDFIMEVLRLANGGCNFDAGTTLLPQEEYDKMQDAESPEE